MKIVIASTNLHKLREYRQLFKNFGNFDVYSLQDFPSYVSPEETGETFEDNAILKASHAANHLQEWVVADDSGLVVPALGKAPGVYSARYAGKTGTAKDCRQKLLREMQGLEGLKRAAYFECWIALVSPQGLQATVKGIVEGTILHKERGSNGFGYDSLFLKYDYDKTFAQLDENIKNRISHRSKAFDRLTVVLESLKTKNVLPD
ncbi:MAG: RdgB/HAM1 family non-canonical purine NTP pyrophosphatase [Chlamydiota bacterium]